MIYAVVNEFLGKVTFCNPEAEAKLVAALVDESSLSLQMHARLEEAFSPIFFYFPNGLKDRSVRQLMIPADSFASGTNSLSIGCLIYGAQQLPMLQGTAENSPRTN